MITPERDAVRYAVVVGVNDYTGSPSVHLDFCTDDAEAFYDALIHYCHYQPDHVTLFSDGSRDQAVKPAYTDILSAVKAMCVTATENDSILLFFAGHGTRDDRDSYLLTREYRSNVLSESSIPMARVNEYFTNSHAKFKIRFFDACHSGRMSRRGAVVLPNPRVEAHLAVAAQGWATLAACREDQYAHELEGIGHGVFSYFLVKGLAGEASVDDAHVSLDNLKVYVMDQTIELTRKLGLEQTPVFSGEQAGSLTLSIVEPSSNNHLPVALERIMSIGADQLAPAPANTPTIFDELRSALSTTPASAAFIAPSQKRKLEIAEGLTQQVLSWAQSRVQDAKASLPDGADFAAERISVSKSPLGLRITEYLDRSPIARELEWEHTYVNVPVPPRTKDLYSSLLGRTEYERTLTGLKETQGYPPSVVLLRFLPANILSPICGMTIAIVPCTFGLYVLCYFASTQLNKGMEERWEESSFSVRLLTAIPLDADAHPALVRQLDELYAGFVSFAVESVRSRHLWLEKLGATPGTRLA